MGLGFDSDRVALMLLQVKRRAYLMEEREVEKTLSLFGRLSWPPLSLSRSMMPQPPDEEPVEMLLGPLSCTPRQAKTLTRASALKFCVDDLGL